VNTISTTEERTGGHQVGIVSMASLLDGRDDDEAHRAAQGADKLTERLITGLVAALREEQVRSGTVVGAGSLVA
jgi:hypothetical protein